MKESIEELEEYLIEAVCFYEATVIEAESFANDVAEALKRLKWAKFLEYCRTGNA